MACVVAFLLKTSVNLSPVNQFLFVANDPRKSIYKIYQNDDDEFPATGSDIRRTNVDVGDLGTYISVYCSKTLESRVILDKISTDMVDLKLIPHHSLFPQFREMDRCSAHLDDIYVNYTNKRCRFGRDCKISWSSLDSFICPPEIIVRMAFKNDISVIGKYKSFAPSKTKHPITVKADKRFRLVQLVNDGTIFTGKYWTTNSVALAWYQGHLHLFQWRGNLGWFPLTQIGEEQENGALLYYFALGNNHEIWNTHDDLPFKINFFMRSLEWTEHEQRVIDQVVSQNADVQLNIEADKGKLHPTIHNGHIGGN